MKKKCTLFVVLVWAATASLQAQIQSGNIMVGADIARFDLGLDKGGNFAFRIDPKVAWFIRDNLALGGYFHVDLATAKDAGTSVAYGLGALARYYFNDEKLNLVRHGRFFVEGNAGIEGDNPAVGDNTNGLGLGIGPGFAYFITPNIGLETLLKYNGIVGFGSRPTSNNLQLGVGFQIYLPSARLRNIQNEMKR